VHDRVPDVGGHQDRLRLTSWRRDRAPPGPHRAPAASGRCALLLQGLPGALCDEAALKALLSARVAYG